MSILDDTHNLYTTGHIFDPFLAYFVFGNPFLALAVAGIWEIMEYVIFETVGHYSVFFLNDTVGEEMWDVLILDIGGTLIGTLIAANLTYYFEKQFVPSKSLWEGNIKNKLHVILWFFLRAIATMPFSALGWECNTILDLCTDNGYHLLPWGVFGILLINGGYIYYFFRKNDFFTWMIVILLCINLPTFQRWVPASVIQISILGGISIIGFFICVCLLFFQYRKPRREFELVPI